MSYKCVDTETLFRKNPHLKKQDLEKIRRWLKKQEHLPKLEDVQILIFLNKNHYQIEAAQRAIDNFFTIRNACPEIFIALPPEVLRSVASVICVNILPVKTPEDYVTLVVKLSDTKTSNFNCVHVANFGIMVVTLHYHKYGFEKGVVLLIDMKGFSFGHLLRLNLKAIRYAFKILQDSAVVKIKGIHLTNAVPFTDKFIALLRPFLKSKLFKKIQVHYPNSNTLYKFLPKECLCEDHGGNLPRIEDLNEQNVKTMLNDYDFFVWYDSQKVDETKRRVDRK